VAAATSRLSPAKPKWTAPPSTAPAPTPTSAKSSSIVCKVLREADEIPDLRVAQIARLKNDIDALKQRLTGRDQTIAALNDFKTEALSQLAAQHDEITRLRGAVTASGNVRRLPARAASIGPCN
jgi:uncharacterized coiled-coil protein SlyX